MRKYLKTNENSFESNIIMNETLNDGCLIAFILFLFIYFIQIYTYVYYIIWKFLYFVGMNFHFIEVAFILLHKYFKNFVREQVFHRNEQKCNIMLMMEMEKIK